MKSLKTILRIVGIITFAVARFSYPFSIDSPGIEILSTISFFSFVILVLIHLFQKDTFKPWKLLILFILVTTLLRSFSFSTPVFTSIIILSMSVIFIYYRALQRLR